MNIYDALRQLNSYDKRMWFQYRHKLYFQQEKNEEINSDEEFLKRTMRKFKTTDSFIAWEKSDEYRNLVALLLESKIANDLLDTYNIVAEQAKTGDDKSVKLLLQLSKDITTLSKEAKKSFNKKDEEEIIEEDDGLSV
ncbi:hypothetical protein [Schinkia azotoformans]|uniref:hypothetical protein n=1 Tax=Schinkia azotoformans TaxID=1454 RepID=UPI002DBE75B6|nr:hypothetical protein [Schinkia azotoformans]MEC1697755.1 hypothetical protein [Schinkia azotoformans]